MTEREKNGWGDRYRADTDLQFFGTITASVSHELNNVISILNQTGGLLEDLLYGAEQGQDITPEQLERIAGKIATQTERGIAIIRRLNSFAHTVDDPVISFDLGELLDNLMALCVRFAGLRGMELSREGSVNSAKITNSPIKVQRLLFLVLRKILGAGQKGDRIIYTLEESGERVTVGFRFITPGDFEPLDFGEDGSLAAEIGAELDVDGSSEGLTVGVIFPNKHESE